MTPRIRRWKALLPIVGAGLVLAAFVTKDVRRENLKDFIDALDSAEGIFAVRGDLDEMSSRLDDIAARMTAADEKARYAKQGSPLADLVAVNVKLVGSSEATLNSWSRFLLNARRLSKRFPSGVSERYEGKITEASSAVSAAEEARYAVTRIKRKGAVDLPTFDSAVGDAGTKLEKASSLVMPLASEIISYADSLQTHMQTDYDRWSYASYVVFFLGWCVGLVGQLLGIHAESPEP